MLKKHSRAGGSSSPPLGHRRGSWGAVLLSLSLLSISMGPVRGMSVDPPKSIAAALPGSLSIPPEFQAMTLATPPEQIPSLSHGQSRWGDIPVPLVPTALGGPKHHLPLK